MMPWWGLAILVLGANFALWGTIGALRLAGAMLARLRGAVAGRVPRRGSRSESKNVVADHATGTSLRRPLTVADVAVLIPAHNEATVIGDSLLAIMALVPRENVHVVSDGSTDATVEIALSTGARVIKTRSNVGKAGALQEAIRRFKLIDRFAVVMLLDADTRVRPGYFAAALPMFDDPKVAAVAGCVKTARDRNLSATGNVLVAHRQRIYAIGQRVLKFGQTWRYTNATHIVPGFASIYRAEVLPQIEMNPPGLVIEDFNMTFEVYHKRLGKVGFNLGAVAVTQDPDTLGDYVRQTKRWALGLWQTVRRHPPRANLFTAMLTLLLLELVTASMLFLLLPLLLVILAIPDLEPAALSWPGFATVHAVVAAHVNFHSVLLGVVVPDAAMTCVAAALERRPRLLLCGPFFPILRVIDAFIAVTAAPLAWLVKSSGRWKSPARRAVVDEMPASTQIALTADDTRAGPRAGALTADGTPVGTRAGPADGTPVGVFTADGTRVSGGRDVQAS